MQFQDSGGAARKKAGTSLDAHRRKRFEEKPEAAERWTENTSRRRLALALIEHRRRAQKSQKEVARLAGWNQTQVARMESATGPWPNKHSLEQFVRACNPSATIGIVIAHSEDERLHIDTAVAFGDEVADQEFEQMADSWVEPPPAKMGNSGP